MSITTLKIGGISTVIENYNNDFLLIKGTNASNLAKIGTAIYHQEFDFIEEVIITEVELCLKLTTRFEPIQLTLLQTLELPSKEEQQIHELPVYFEDTEDWKKIEAITKRSKSAIIEQLTTIPFSIAMFAFLPGFVYLNGLPNTLHIPRKTVPAKYIPPNSLAIGGKYLGIYSLPSPGGWHVIGRLPIPVLQLPDLPPVLLNVGDTVQLRAIEEKEYRQLLISPV